MALDVLTAIDVDCPRAEVADFAADPDNATAWYENIKSVAWKTAKPLAVGSEVAFAAEFMGQRLAYTYAIKEFVPGSRLVMCIAQGPFAMETTYLWTDTPSGGTRMMLRNRGKPSGFGRLAAPFMARSVPRANERDLKRLKHILELRSARESENPRGA
jgi:hypothetical protein